MTTKLFTFFFVLIASAGTILASDTQVDGIWYIFDDSNNTAIVTYQGSKSDEYVNEYSGSVIIPSTVKYNGTTYSVTSVGDEAFYDCYSMTLISIPNSVTRIGKYAFRGCSNLRSVEIPSSVTSLEYQAFNRCTNLTTVTLGNGVQNIGDAAFMYCSNLSYITIPHSVKSIEEHAFWYCTSLTSVTIGDGVTRIGNGAFSDCTSLTSVTIGKGVTNLGYSDFKNCNNIEIVTIYSNALMTSRNMKNMFGAQVKEYIIGESVTRISDSAFDGCSDLVSVTLDKGVANIGDYAFKGCGRLRNFYNKSTTPQLISANVFENAEVKNCKLYVPKASIGLYEEEPYWKDFMKILPLEESSIQSMQYPSNVEQTKIIKEGKVLIKRGDKEYDMTGKEVR